MLSVRLMLVRMVCLTTNKMDEENNTSEVGSNWRTDTICWTNYGMLGIIVQHYNFKNW
jgi:hypothetical protein